jgi:hypothetical protein
VRSFNRSFIQLYGNASIIEIGTCNIPFKLFNESLRYKLNFKPIRHYEVLVKIIISCERNLITDLKIILQDHLIQWRIQNIYDTEIVDKHFQRMSPHLKKHIISYRQISHILAQ